MCDNLVPVWSLFELDVWNFAVYMYGGGEFLPSVAYHKAIIWPETRFLFKWPT